MLKTIEAKSGRPVVVYAANFRAANTPNNIDHTDITPFSELTGTVPGKRVDVVIHSPGGLAEAAERIVALLRARFEDVRFVVLHSSFSAGTMLAMSGNAVVLDDTSALGPIDPQIVYRDPATGQSVAIPTQTILDGFEHAKQAIKKDAEAIGVYLPLLNKLDLHLFEICKNAEKLSKTLVKDWLKQYMFKGDPKAGQKAAKATKYLSSHKDRLSHGRPITIDTAKNTLKLKVVDLRGDVELRQLYNELWTEVEWFVDSTDTYKFFENAYGVGFRRRFQVQQQLMFQLPIPLQQGIPQVPQQPPQEPTKDDGAATGAGA